MSDTRATYLAALTRKIEAEAEKFRAEAAATKFALHRERLLLHLFPLALLAVSLVAFIDPAMLEALGAGGILVTALGLLVRH